MCRTQELNLSDNQIGDAGVTALAQACAGGALPALTELYMCEDAPALKAACEARGVSYY